MPSEPRVAVSEQEHQQKENVFSFSPVRRWREKLLFFVLILTAAVSISACIAQWQNRDFFVRYMEQLAPDHSLVPATRAYLRQLIEAASFLITFLSLFAVAANFVTKPRRPIVFCMFVGLTAILHWLYYYSFTIDDAYISFVYARNLAAGRGLVFNIGERVEGYTNLLWVLLEALFFKIRLDPLIPTKIIGLLCGLGTLYYTYLLSRLTFQKNIFVFLAPLLLAISPVFAAASALGLETQLFTFLIVVAAFTYLKSGEKAPGYQVPLLLGLATLARPEGALFFVIIYGHSFFSQLLRRRLYKRFLLTALIYVFILAAFAEWRWVYYGTYLPNTYYAKLEGSNWKAAWGYQYVKDFFNTFGGALFALLIVPFAKREKLRRNLFLFLLIAPYLLYVAYAGGDWIPRFRFIEPVLPFILLLFTEGLSELFVAFENRVQVSLTAKAVVLLLLGFIVHFYFTDTVGQHRFAMVRAGGAIESHIDLGKWLHENTTPEDSIALMDIGMVKYYSDREVIDISGLTDAHIAHLPGGFLKKQFDIEYLLEQKPKYVVLVSHNDISIDKRFISSYGIDKQIYDNRRFQKKYRFLFNRDHLYLRDNPQPDDGYWMNVFERH